MVFATYKMQQEKVVESWHHAYHRYLTKYKTAMSEMCQKSSRSVSVLGTKQQLESWYSNTKKDKNGKLYNQLTTIIRRLIEAQTDALMSDGTALSSICREDLKYPQFLLKISI